MVFANSPTRLIAKVSKIQGASHQVKQLISLCVTRAVSFQSKFDGRYPLSQHERKVDVLGMFRVSSRASDLDSACETT